MRHWQCEWSWNCYLLNAGNPSCALHDDNLLARHLFAVTSVAIWGFLTGIDQRERGPAFRLRAQVEAGWPVSAETDLASIPAISA